ncbi:MAG: FtsX-like permease family protein [Luteitalea sp.]|nr:FtsX-like permease family protein [Luteitalea sp.]
MRRRLLRAWLWKPSVDEEVDGELAFHLEMRRREYVARGMSSEEARQAALRRFGDVRLAHDTCWRLGRDRDRQMRRREYLAELRQDVGFGWRQLWKNPGFAFVAIVTLALGIGATTAIFSAVHAVVLRPLPYHEPHRLVYLFERWRDIERGGVSVGNFVEWSRRATLFDGIAAIQYDNFNVTEGRTPERVIGAHVSGHYFDVLGVGAALGRTFGRDDDQPGREDVVILSHRLWARRFAGDPGVVGREVRLSGRQHTVVGVMPASFDVTMDGEELWVPAAFSGEEQADFDRHFLTISARLAPGVTIDQAQTELATIAAQLEKEQPIFNAQRGANIEPMMAIFVGDYRQRLFAPARTGASRCDSPVVRRSGRNRQQRRLRPRSRVASNPVLDMLRGGRSGGMGAPRDRVRSALVVAEVALALLLLIGSGLLIRTALALGAVDPGFDPRGVLSARVALPRDDYLDHTRTVQALEGMVDETRVVPGVTRAAVVSQVPLGPGGNSNGLIPEGRPMGPRSVIVSQLRLVSPRYFETMRIPIKEGRRFTDQDREGVQKVMIISEALARQAWPKENAIGKRISCCEPGPGGIRTPDYKVVVGVAGDVRSFGLAVSPMPEFYLPIAQAPSNPPGAAWDWVQRTMYIVARTPTDPAALASSVARAIRQVDPKLPLFNVRTMEERMASSVAASRFNTVLLTTLGIMGLLLAAIGIYGVIAYFVSQRTQEIGVRLALGAAPADVARLVIRQALKPVLVGLFLGVTGALAVSGLLANQLYGVEPRDPMTIAALSLGFVLVALLASWAPARRAARVDPTRALNTA